MIDSEFKNVIVSKAWGVEYEVFRNDSISLWCLRIEAFKSTSMHAHINKRTGLVIVKGEAILSFMHQSHYIEPLDKYNIYPRSFHKTAAKTDVTLLEVESPPNKADLVRMSDDYGRAGQPYEAGPYLPKPPDLKNIVAHGDRRRFGDCMIYYHPLDEDDSRERDDVIIVANGGLVTAEKVQIVYPGDILWSWQLRKLLLMSEPMPQTEVLQVVKIGSPGGSTTGILESLIFRPRKGW